jgi:hypothetical protein
MIKQDKDSISILDEYFIDFELIERARVIRKVGLVLFSLDLPYFMGDSKIYRFARKYSNLGEE